MVRLSKRLQTVVSFVTPGNTVADVGCDHAHTGIFLVQAGISPRVIAMDLRKGPLELAKENVLREGMKEKIELRLSDGLDKLAAGETDTILISGMGGPLILEILKKNIQKALAARELVLSPQSDLEGFPEGLRSLGFEIGKTGIVKEDDKFYFVFRACPIENGENRSTGTECERSFPVPEPAEVWTEFLEKEKEIKRRVLKKLEADNGEKASLRRGELYNDIRRIEDEINRMRN